MEHNNVPDASLVPPVVDEAELIGNSSADIPVFEAEPEEELNLSLHAAGQQGLVNGEASGLANQTEPPLTFSSRPGLQRGTSAPHPAPLHLPPPVPSAPPPDAPPTDSLSLSQLQNLVREAPKSEPTPYAFTYDDASSFEEELEEWFSYAVEEQAMLLKAQASFALEWTAFNGLNETSYTEGGLDWNRSDRSQHKNFLEHLLEEIKQTDPVSRLKTLEALVYVLLGCWHETAGRPSPSVNGEPTSGRSSSAHNTSAAAYDKSGQQASLIRQNVLLLAESNGIQTLVDVLRSSCLRACGVDVVPDAPREGKEAERREVWCAMTAVYVVLEVARTQEKAESDFSLRSTILCLEKPGLLMLLVELISKLRWDESITLPLSKVSLLLWKTVLVCFGGIAEAEKAKDSFKDKTLESADVRGQPIITASPLDYHLFRQEISSKYPAYNPPPPFFPLEPENNSILPPLKNHPNKVAGNHVFGSGLGDLSGNINSILHQPVHIATPAPSPPPSPAGPGGKGGKKQNYQTNQMFPFLYPPLDESSNKLGGKGSTDLQDLLVGRKWEGSDIPASILEAADLFATRMRATRAMKQLWEERVAFMKYERGWMGADDDNDIDHLSLEPKQNVPKKDPHPTGSVQERMELVEEFYRNALPNLQSMIIVLIKAILSHVTALVTQSSGANGLQSGFQYQDNQTGTTNGRPDMNGVNGHGRTVATNEELDAMRTQEVLDKSVTGTLILILKWFKVSHILKFEYITQLLVDSSYVPLILKLLQLQEIEKIVNFKSEQEELNFFNFCRAHSRNALEEEEEEKVETKQDADSDSDEAVPPPIRKLREENRADSETDPSRLPIVSQPPEVDELGFPTNELPKEPITNFSWRAFFTSINYLRIMQKICKNKAHRNLMLVSYKSSQFLRKSLKVPQPELRLYTLKLFKNQVPYCGRKWRQSNMRVITAVYLHCRPELRDDWLAGSDVDAEVDESVPLEQALRSLTHWHNLKRYPESLGAKPGILEEEHDFFRNELEKMDWGDELANDANYEQGWQDLQVEGW
ncbi:N1221-domain-containing protein [Dothidotthia symphoricarpi CBS 119687]|uniref:N1221-domain-containing protein n=1 Tax=Dothidotthia symphoricarpi CBS 119687 TaxID=1392245 RepID=A0A6A6ABB3_9PLEO|nr:N1221-domain-containing protein [Dothidotthia symphoricarpi CBS 119687]KAF2129110.1 N1221-domain-containing protein [Dothidotthia symphoricarpi CBS 119687]